VAKPANQLRGNQAPPKAQQAPKPDLKIQPKSETSGRQPNVDQGNPQSQLRQAEPGKTPVPGRSEAAPRETKAQPESQPRANQRTPTSTSEKTVQPAEKKAVTAREPAQVQEPAAATHETAAPAPRNSKAQSETRQSVPAAAESKPGAKPEVNPRAAIREPNGQNASQQPVKQERSVQPSDKKAQQVSEQPAKRTPDPSVKGATKLMKKDTKKKGEEPQTPPGNPAISP
jgi:hypothetical protein